MRKLLHNQVICTLLALTCGCNVVINNPGPDDGESLGSWSESDTTTSTTTTDSTSTGGGTPCHDSTIVEGTVISECCPESLGTCADWCAEHGFGECLETIISVGDASCGSPDAHGDLCNVDAFDIIVATELAVQCVCDQPGLDTGSSDTSTGTDSSSSTDSTTGGGCEQTPEYPDNPPACVSCSDASQCRADEDCFCSSDFGAGVCLPTAWNECSWAPCDTPCLYVDGDWICGLPGC